jgi:hypothetical protein
MDDDVEVARKALEHAVANPTAFSAADINAFADVVERANSKPTVLPEVKVYGDPKSKDTPLDTPLSRSPEPQDPLSVKSPKGFKAADDAHQQWAANLFDPNAHTASKIRELARDPEYHPPIPKHDGLVDSLLHPIDSLNSAARLIGGADRVYEPSLDAFRRDMAPHLGDKAGKLDENSPEYKMYADAQWAKAYDQAKAEGKSLIRQQYHQNEGWKEKVVSGAHDAMANGVSAMNGAADSMSLGGGAKLLRLLDRAAGTNTAGDVANLDETHSAAHTIGEIGGALAPGGIGNTLVREGGNALRGAGIVSKAPSFLKSVGAGAALGATDTLGRAGINAAAGDATGDVAHDTLVSSLLGGAMGGAGDLVGKGAGKMVQGLRAKLPELPIAEELGGHTDVMRGFVPGERYGALKQEADALGTGPRALLASKLAPPLAEQGALTAAEGQAATGKVNQQYYAAHGNVRRPVDPLLNAATELHDSFHGPDGRPLPGQNERAVAMLRSEIGKMADVEVAPTARPGYHGYDGPAGPTGDFDFGLGKAPVPPHVDPAYGQASAAARDHFMANEGKLAHAMENHPEPGHPGSNPESDKAWSSLLEEAPKYKGTVYRGTTMSPEEIQRLLASKKLPGSHMYTSADPEEALRYAQSGQGQPVVFHIDGADGVALGGVPRYQATEVGVPAGRKFSIVGATEDESGTLNVQVRGSGAPKAIEPDDGAMSFAEARKRGFDVDHALRGLPPDVQEAIQSDLLDVGVHVTPKRFNPKETDTVISGLDAALKAAQGPGGGPHPELNRLLEASRAVRDQFPDHQVVPGGSWSGFKHDASMKMAAEERAAAMAGVPGAMRGDMTANEAIGLHGKILGYGDPNRHPEIDQSLRGLAGRAGGEAPQQLEDVRRVAAAESMKDKTGFFAKVRNGMPIASLSQSGIQMRLDPLARSATGLRGGAVGGSAGALRNETADDPKPMSFDEINRLLNPTGAY